MQVIEKPAFQWMVVVLRLIWYLFLLLMIFALFQGPDKGFRYLGL